ncbi:adenylate/guanylate cyclase domain-containing protein [bacterium]|nr:adenylate/guanylate cyclase domain-containing protein [bacterium]
MTRWWSVVPVIVLFAFLKISQSDFVQSIEYSYYDQLQRNHDITKVDDIVLVNIDEKAIEKEGQYPWPRQTVAKYIDQAPNNSLLVSTMIWSEKDRFAGDQELSQSLSQKAVVLASAPTHQTTTTELGIYANVSTFGKPSTTLIDYSGLLTPIPELAQMAMGVGAVSAEVDQPSGVLRRVPLLVSINDQPYPSLGLDTVRVFLGEPSYTIKNNELGMEWVRLGRQDPITTQPTSELPVAFWHEFEQISILDPLPEGKVLIFGVTAEGYSNPVATPMGAMYPHEIQAQQIYTLMSGVEILRPDYTRFIELLMILLACTGILIAVYRLGTVWACVVSITLLGASPALGYYAWTTNYFFLDIIWPTVAGIVVFAQSSFNKYYTTYKLKEQIKKQFGTYLSPAMVQKLQDDPTLLRLGGETRYMTFLFCDIRGFTPISEQYKTNPQGLTSLVNRFLTPMTDIIMDNEGTIDKYMGDCIFAFWNAPLDVEEQERLAVKTSIEMYEGLDMLNKELESEGLLPINIGVGINTGECVVGNMGSDQRFDYSVLGDAVNLAARLEGQTKSYGVKTIIGHDTMTEIHDEYVTLELDNIAVKGKEEPAKIYTVLGTYDWWNSNSHIAMESQQHEKMMEMYKSQQFDHAINLCEQLKGCFLGQMSDYYDIWIERCNDCKGNVPEDWDGTYIATTK